ncbi:hypothetical protein LJC45_01510 [Alistipes sp. OttesenSCG-928-B03]|nr:hypothetical protein [Alistipes sp. OttesenSCG-928-B03]
MKKVLQIVLALVVIGLAVWLYTSIMAPIHFKKEVDMRENAVKAKLLDIRAAQQAYRSVHAEYTPSFDSLIHFVLNDSLTFTRQIGDPDDSLAVARGEVYFEDFRIPAQDTVFSRKLSRQDILDLPTIPYSDNKQFFLNAGHVVTDSHLVVPVFECSAPYNYYLWDVDPRQEVDNMIDEAINTRGAYPGLKVGDMKAATNDAANWD